MRIEKISRVLEGETQQISADLFGFPLWYRFPADLPLVNIEEAFLAMALIPAMARSESLEVNPGATVSTSFLVGSNRIMEVLRCWDSRLHSVSVSAARSESPPGRAGVGSFFSGGVDGTFTLLSHVAEITDLILIHGLEIDLRNRLRFEKVLSRTSAIAAGERKRLIPVTTNARDFCRHVGVSMTVLHGALMASIALFLGFAKTYIASSHTYAELIPWGSHPLLDPLWSTETSRIVHDGAETSRTEKIRGIAKNQEALDWLRVCGNDTVDYNCGSCEKCLRTMMSLRLLGATSAALPLLGSMKDFRKIRLGDRNEWLYARDNHALATTVGDRDAVRTLARLLRRYETRRFVKTMDQLMFRGSLRAMLRGKHPANEAISFD
jgi:hypothetical protein